MPIVREDVLRTLAFDIFSATGVPVEDARIVADHLVRDRMERAADLTVPLRVDVGIGENWMAAKGGHGICVTY